MEETGVVNVADPLGGSWYVEALTDRIEAEANAIFDKILAMGGSTLTHADTDAGEPSRATGAADGAVADDPRPAARHRGGLVHVARSPRPPSSTRSPSRRARSGSSASTATRTPSPTTWRSCGSPTRSRSSRCATLAAPSHGARRGRGRRGAGPDGRGRPHRREHDRADARRLPRRGDPRRDLRRAARRVGRVPRACSLLRCA